ncbi:pyruvate kinase [Gregarina niphandrodes]|uniref:Pyruvate kinase n=1 Tax=Gregarina niphandrodes TaxID=110365 RepID=A0A023B7A6_GRENI|nr:pyruvate kinase [Gregarina niphandrodes]EZG67029.1 pyruvate kinase [Gregarina niphandrodes]|eukprot:XP_011130356.1 pyruvate kinase [Gregarina niphandrodes]
MLSGESANGQFPVNAVRMLANTALEAESCLDYKALYKAIHSSVMAKGPVGVSEAIAASAVESAEDVNASVIVALTQTGYTARLLAKFKPRQMIIAVSSCPITCAQTTTLRGVIPVLADDFKDTEALIAKGVAAAKARGFASTGDAVVAVHGVKEEGAGNTSLMKIVVA